MFFALFEKEWYGEKVADLTHMKKYITSACTLVRIGQMFEEYSGKKGGSHILKLGGKPPAHKEAKNIRAENRRRQKTTTFSLKAFYRHSWSPLEDKKIFLGKL